MRLTRLITLLVAALSSLWSIGVSAEVHARSLQIAADAADGDRLGRRTPRLPGATKTPEPAPAPTAAPAPKPTPPAAKKKEADPKTVVTPEPPAAPVVEPAPVAATQVMQGNLPAVDFDALKDPLPMADRWKVVETLYPRNFLDPYNTNNPLKGDRHVFGQDWFFNLGVVSDTLIEPRYIPVPVGLATTARAGTFDTLGDGTQLVFNQSIEVETVLYKGDTTFKPPDFEFRFTPVFNYNRVSTQERGLLNVDPTAADSSGTERSESFFGIKTLFADIHLRNVSDRYDFDSVRVGVQPFTADFRGFLYRDDAFGVRLFGIRDNNRFQYNLAWFRRIEKDTNSGVNDLGEGLRKDDVYVANLYWQDLAVPGFTSQLILIHNRNREGGDTYYDKNGFLVRPAAWFDERGKDYTVTYLGYNGDGHLGPWNLSASTYYVFGSEDNTRIKGETNAIGAGLIAAEVSRDYDWIRGRAAFLYASGDADPYDDKSTGFDAILESPQFAGADTSYYIRQSLPLIGGGGVALSGRNGVLNSLRSSKDEGQSNFINPGITLLGAGADLDVLPELRVAFNVNALWFNQTAVLQALRQQSNVDRAIGTDVSAGVIYRPFMTQNVVLRTSAAMLLPGQGYKDLYGDDDTLYSVLVNLVLTY